jgi:hypothetical protein
MKQKKARLRVLKQHLRRPKKSEEHPVYTFINEPLPDYSFPGLATPEHTDDDGDTAHEFYMVHGSSLMPLHKSPGGWLYNHPPPHLSLSGSMITDEDGDEAHEFFLVDGDTLVRQKRKPAPGGELADVYYTFVDAADSPAGAELPPGITLTEQEQTDEDGDMANEFFVVLGKHLLPLLRRGGEWHYRTPPPCVSLAASLREDEDGDEADEFFRVDGRQLVRVSGNDSHLPVPRPCPPVSIPKAPQSSPKPTSQPDRNPQPATPSPQPPPHSHPDSNPS